MKITPGTAMVGTFEIEGQRFLALNGGPMFKFNEAISLLVNCDTQEEVAELWTKLSAGGSTSRCGWLKAKSGLSWQIVPRALGRLMQDPDPAKSGRMMRAMMQMTKIDIAELEKAHRGRVAPAPAKNNFAGLVDLRPAGSSCR